MSKLGKLFLLFLSISFSLTTNALSDNFQNNNEYFGFLISSLIDNDWIYQGTLSYDYHFSTKNIELNLNTQQQKELRIRIQQIGQIDAAHIDYLALKIGDKEIIPTSVVDLDNKNDILYKVSKLDNDVVDVKGHIIEATWRNINTDKASLIMNAREEDLETLPGVPFKIEMYLY